MHINNIHLFLLLFCLACNDFFLLATRLAAVIRDLPAAAETRFFGSSAFPPDLYGYKIESVVISLLNSQQVINDNADGCGNRVDRHE